MTILQRQTSQLDPQDIQNFPLYYKRFEKFWKFVFGSTWHTYALSFHVQMHSYALFLIHGTHGGLFNLQVLRQCS